MNRDRKQRVAIGNGESRSEVASRRGSRASWGCQSALGTMGKTRGSGEIVRETTRIDRIGREVNLNEV